MGWLEHHLKDRNGSRHLVRDRHEQLVVFAEELDALRSDTDRHDADHRGVCRIADIDQRNGIGAFEPDRDKG